MDIIVDPKGIEQWEGTLVGTPMEKTMQVVKQFASGQRPESNKLFDSEERFQEERSDYTLIHAWAIASDWAELEKALNNLNKMHYQDDTTQQIREIIYVKVARMLVPHLDDVQFMSTVANRAIESLTMPR